MDKAAALLLVCIAIYVLTWVALDWLADHGFIRRYPR